MSTNIDRFNLTTLQLFNQLYDAFPSEITIETALLGAEAAPQDLPVTDMLTYAMRADDVVTWLAAEGFIRVAAPSIGTEYFGVRLTLKGLTVLGYLPTSLKPNEPSEPLIGKIKRTLASGAEKAGTEAVKAILGGVFKLAIAHASSSGSSSGISA